MVIRDKLVVDFSPQSAQRMHKVHEEIIVSFVKSKVSFVKSLVSLEVSKSFITTKCTKDAQSSRRNYSVLGEEQSVISG